jgi:hypothetical protein
MIKILDAIVRWTLYPILFGILFSIYYIGSALFLFKLPDVNLKKECILDPLGLHDICIADFAYYLSWAVLIFVALGSLLNQLMK